MDENTISRRRFLVLAGAAGAATACGAPTTTAPSASTAVPSPTRSNATINYAIATDPLGLEPGMEGTNTQKQAINTMFESLTYLTPEGNVQPSLATEWRVSTDGLKWTFKLRSGVTFHDGEPLNADAVKFSLDRVLDPANKLEGRRFAEPVVKSVAVLAPDTVEFTLKGPFAAMPQLAGQTTFGVISPKAARAAGVDFSRKPVGSGPFVFKEWKSAQHVVVERNEKYWGTPAVAQRIVFLPVPEAGTRMAMIESGAADLAEDIPYSDAKRIRGDQRFQLVTSNALEVKVLRINMLDDRLKDVRVRQALQYALNVQEIIDSVLAGFAKPAAGAMPTGVPGALTTRKYRYDAAMAKTLLSQAGYANGFSTTLAYRDDPEVQQAIQAQYRAVGINATLQRLDATAYATHNNLQPTNPAAKAKGLTYHGSTYRYADPNFMLPVFHSRRMPPNGTNYGYFANARLDQLLDQGQVESDPTKRAALYKEAQDILTDDPASAYMFEVTNVYGASRPLSGAVLTASGVLNFAPVGKR